MRECAMTMTCGSTREEWWHWQVTDCGVMNDRGMARQINDTLQMRGRNDSIQGPPIDDMIIGAC